MTERALPVCAYEKWEVQQGLYGWAKTGPWASESKCGW